MPIKLKDIPVGRLTPDETEALSNKTFDYADKERVSMREAERRIKEEVHNDSIRRQLLRAGDFEAAWKIPSYEPPYTLEKGPPEDFGLKEKIFQFGRAVHRGLGAIVKVPGVALKAIGEHALTREEIAELKKSPYAIQRLRARGMESPAGKGARSLANMLRQAGNKYIEVVNGMMLDESPESIGLRSQAFMSAPLYRTSMAAGESVPTYGLAIATTLTSGNPNLGLLILGTTTASSSYENLRQQGVDPDLALIGATLEGSIEMVTEKIPMDMLMKGAARPLLIRALSIGTAESFQELFAQLGQNYVSAVIKDIDPENYDTVLVAARQEWSVIKQGWEDAMAAGFVMGAGGGALVSGGLPATDFGFRTAEEMRADYGFVPRNVNEIISLTDQVKQRVKDIEKKAKEAEAPEAKPTVEAPPEIAAMPTEQLHEKFRATKITDPQWQTLYEEVVRRKEAEVPPTVPIAEPTEAVAGQKEEVAPETKPAEKQPTDLQKGQFEIIEVSLDQISLSGDVPNFKEGADPETGIVPGRELKGKYERLGSAPIIIWKRKNGKLEIITGRHRFDLAKRSGEKTIPAQIVEEELGYTREMALTLDAESNIRDEQGSIEDYAHYFKNTNVSEKEAEQRGLLSRTKGQVGFVIGKSATDNVFTGFINGKISATKAAAIARGAPNNEAAQNAALQKVDEKSADELEQFARILTRYKAEDSKKASQGDLFGFDDSAIVEADKISKEVNKATEEIKDRILSVKGALKRPETAKKMGLNFSDEPSLRKEVARLEERLDELSRTSTTPALWAEMRKRAGLAPEAKPTPKPEAVGVVPRKSVERIEKEARGGIITPQQAIDELLMKQKEIETDPKSKLPKGSFNIYTKAAQKKLDEIGWAITRQMAKPEAKEYGSGNILITTAEYEKAKAALAEGEPLKGKDRMKGAVRIFTPEDLVNVGRVALYHFESGLRTFRAWSERMIAEFGDSVKPHLLSLWEDLEGRVPLPAQEEIGVGEIKPRGTSVSVMAQAIENEIVEENKAIYDELPTYRAMNMKEQAEKALALIEDDIEKAKRVAFYQEPAPPDLFPENVFSALRTYAKMNLDIDLIMDLALKEDVVREHTIMGKRIKSLDTDQDYADPVRAIREVVEARMEGKIRRGEDISALEVKLRELQAELDKATKERAEFTKRAERTYGKRNKLVSRTEYDTIMARRKKEAVGFAGRAGGVAYVPNVQDFTDIAKIATFHLEAMGRDFAKWSYQMTRDFGDWITPHLQDEYDKAIAEAKKAGVEIKESKRLITKKKRLATTTGKIEAKLEELDLAKVPRIPIELDEEGQRLQAAYDVAREKYKAAQAVANIITEKEVRIIAQLSKDAAERKAIMEKSERRKEGEGATKIELEYGTAISLFLEYVNDLKVEANKRTMGEVIRNYLSNPVDFISDFAGTLKAAKASLDNSFHLRQGLPTFLKAITGHIPSAKIWWKTFIKSWKMMWDTLRKRKVMRGLFAEMISDPDYELLKKSKVALNVIEEEIPVDIPSRIPLLGILFRMGENAFVGSSRYMRYQLAKQYLNVWRKSGVELNQRELESIGRLANSQTGRGETAAKSQKPGLLNNVFWSPRNLRAYVDILTVHMFDRNMSPFARKQAAINLLRYISGAAMILALAKWIDDDSVTWDTKSSDFGKIRVGNTRFSVGGGMAILVILASRLVNRKFTSSTTGETKSIDTGKFGALGGKDLVFNFLENKLSPAAGLALSIIDQKTWDGNKLTIPQMVNDALTPLIIQNVFETGSADDSANVLAALIAETMGVNVQTYSDKKRQKTNKRTKL